MLYFNWVKNAPAKFLQGGPTMSEDRGFIDQVSGKAKEVAGDLTGNKEQKAEGLVEQAVGKTKEVAADLKDKAEEVVEKVKEKFDNKDA